jgi:hypothetical protein
MNKFKLHSTLFAISICVLILLFLNACSSTKPTGKVMDYNHTSRPDYSDPESWAALPTKHDSADLVPHPDLNNRQQEALIDVFFLHPTTYTGSKGQDQWNAPVDEAELNQKTDRGSIKNQASIFNGVGRVFAPRYRQAHIHSYFTKDTIRAKNAFALAYKDVKAAFEFYLTHYNEGRPIIIAGHSQGTTHAKQLLREYFDEKPLQNQLVAAYLVGMPVPIDYFETIEVCKNAEQTGCFNSWRTWKKGHFPDSHMIDNSLAVTNPLSWTTQESYAPKALNKGSVLQNFEDSFYPGITDAQVQNGVLWITKPKFPGSMFVWFKNYHIADYNLFYVNVRENAQTRAHKFLEQQALPAGNTSQ